MNLEAIYDVPVEISVLLGSTKIPVYNLLKLGRGAVVELDKKVGEELDVYVNERLVARGEVVIVENRIGITLTEIIKS
ncbi:MAG: flagellar motor switch protein FliN [Pseudomonadota bacterium]